MDRRVQIGIVVALIALLLFVSVPQMITDQTERLRQSGDGSELDGYAYAHSKLTDEIDNIVWSSQDDRYNLPESVVHTATGKDAVNFEMGFRYDATGSNIDWSTMSINAKWECLTYESTTVTKLLDYEWDTEALNGQQSGDLHSTKVSIDPLVPEGEVLMIFWDFDESGRKIRYTETYAQRTEESHPFRLTFYGHYYLDVYDIYGYKYSQYYQQKVVLSLTWVGSDVEWSDAEDEEPDTTGSVPALNALADLVTYRGDIDILTWTWADVNADIQRYTISVDGVVKSQVALSGSSGEISYSYKFTELGEHTVSITIEDLQGNTATDTVTVFVHDGAEVIEPKDDDTIDPIDPNPLSPSERVDGTQTFERGGSNGDTPAMSLFGGSANTQVIVLIAIAGGAGWLLYNRKKR